MTRASRARSVGQPPVADPARAASPFEVLAALRGQRRAATEGGGRRGAQKAVTRQQPTTRGAEQPPPGTDALTPEDLALFHAAVDDATPLPSDNRIELDTPKPAPVPRLRAPAESEEEAPSAPRRRAEPSNDDALFRAAVEDVIPLKDSGRLDIGPAPRRARRGAAQAAWFAADTPMPLEATPPEPSDPAALFRHAVRGTQPIDARNRVELERPPPPPTPLKRAADEEAALRESMEAPLSFEDRLDMGDEAAFLRPGLPRRVLTDLRRGRWVLQGELDLHGLNREEARDALARFLAASLLQGRRCVRVIHGKGLGSPGRFGLLKHLSRGWLAQREEILAFCQAGPHAGGSGALLVLLRAGAAAQSAAPDENS